MKKKKKTILFPVFDGTITKNLLRTDFLRFLKESGARIVIIPPKNKIDAYKEEFSDGDSVLVEDHPFWRHDKMEWFFSGLFKHSIPTEFMKIRQVDWYWNEGRYLTYVFVSVLRALGRFRFWRKFLLLLNKLEPITWEAKAVYKKWSPDQVFAPTMIMRDEVCLMRLARRDGKSVIGMAKSFDNLTSKAYLRIHPDHLIVPNSRGIEEAVELYNYAKEKVHITGICQYDVYNEESIYEDKDTFFDNLGLDKNKRTILYAPAGDWMNPNDDQTLSKILDWIESGKLTNTQVLLRLHPTYTSGTEKLRGRKNLVVERPGEHTGSLKSYEFKHNDVRHLASSLKHADIVINTASTLMVEGSIVDTPVIALGFDGDEKLSYWHSVIRYYDREHCLPIVEAGGVRIVASYDELFDTINEYFDYPEHDREERKKVALAIAYKLDGRACERTAQVLIDALHA